MSLQQIVDAHRSGAASVVEHVTACLDRIERLDGELNAFRETYRDQALAAARTLDRRIADGDDPGPLAGATIAIKDNLATDFGRTACGSRLLEEYRSPFTATAVQRLTDAGAVVVGKTNCDEFGMGSSTEHCAFGPTRNPWDRHRVPGGSSGGSACAVAAALCDAALGSETGGSIRQPAALCGTVGVKPSYGRVSRYGLVAFGSSLDQVGPFATTVGDAARVMGVMAGADRLDSTCADSPVPDYLESLERPPEGLRIGVAREFLGDDNDPAVNDAMLAAIEVFRGAGAEIVELKLPRTGDGLAAYYVIAPAEASSNLARYDGIRYGRRAVPADGEDLFDLYARSRAEGFGPEVRRRIMLGTYVLSAGYHEAYYVRALQVRRLIKNELDDAFARCHALIGPTSPTPAFGIGEKADPLAMYRCDLYTVNANIAGICAMSVPAGFVETGGVTLPIGLQIQCPAFAEQTMFQVARLFERETGHGRRRAEP